MHKALTKKSIKCATPETDSETDFENSTQLL